MGRAGVAEPGIIGDIDEKARPLLNEAPGKIRKYYFIADKHTEWRTRKRHERYFLPRPEITDPLNHFIQEKEEVFKRYVFAVWDQMHLVVSPGDSGVRREKKGAVKTDVAFLLHLQGRAADEQVRPAAADQVEQRLLIARLILKVERGGRFRPYNQFRPGMQGLRGQFPVPVHGFVTELLVPLNVLRNVSLNQTDGNRRRSGGES
ncbi:MAG: hypothetical protein BWY71_01958 [Planctomycetes bacterium ADurb.Bin412]|nr:MAG: hypothetical protein BWY71_01958 [Planctomycetes bacterium ADurb.Bin412]